MDEKLQFYEEGRWNQEEIHHHINTLETLAVKKALTCITKTNVVINLFLVSKTTRASLWKQGSSKNPFRYKIITSLLYILQKNKIQISIQYISADLQSRRKSLFPSETELDQTTFNLFHQLLSFTLTTDIFTNEKNHKIPQFITSIPSKTAPSDAFLQNWNQLGSIYIFPPPSFINRVIYKLRKTPLIHHIVLITPYKPRAQ